MLRRNFLASITAAVFGATAVSALADDKRPVKSLETFNEAVLDDGKVSIGSSYSSIVATHSYQVFGSPDNQVHLVIRCSPEGDGEYFLPEATVPMSIRIKNATVGVFPIGENNDARVPHELGTEIRVHVVPGNTLSFYEKNGFLLWSQESQLFVTSGDGKWWII